MIEQELTIYPEKFSQFPLYRMLKINRIRNNNNNISNNTISNAIFSNTATNLNYTDTASISIFNTISNTISNTIFNTIYDNIILKIINIIEKEYNQNKYFIINNYLFELCYEPKAINLIEQLLSQNINLELIVWDNLSVNSEIFTYNYKFIANYFNPIKEELIQKCFNPKNLSKFEDWGYEK